VLEERRPDGPDRGPDQGGPAAGASVRPLLLVRTTGAVHVRPGDQVDLGVCALPGLVHTAAAEVPWLAVRQLDLPAHPEAWATAVRGELADHGHSGAFAAREGQRWQRRVRPVPQGDAAGSPAVTPGGVYLVTGGLGGIARDLAGYLLAAYGVRLVLVGRSPAKDEKADALAELRGLGEVMYHQADVADAAELGAAVTAAEKHWGRPLDGVLHLAAASVDDQWADLERHALAREGKDAFTRQYAAKVAGTLALAGLLEGRPDASLTLFGSVNGEFGGRSFGAYAAASAFLAGFADHWHHERGRPVRCLAWSAWENVGMNQGRSTAPARRRGFLPITPDEGLRTFLTATALPYHYLLIGLDFGNPLILDEVVGDELSAREVLVAYAGEGTDPQAVRAALEPGLRDLAVPVRVTELRRIPRDAAGAVDTAQLLLALRRSGQKDYQAPQTDLERQLAQILAEVTGQSDVGRTDSFFDLGGTSLHATRMLAQIGERLAVRLSTDELYRNPTVAGVAAVISAR
jgi:NAD(P)-dependent dehydrogenase (short-subunit alcohol dehydrogenase family)